MLPFAYYLLKVIICSGVLFGYYWFFLRNKIYHQYNRFYLLAIVLLSLALPMMKINIWHKASEPQPGVIRMLQVVNSSDEYMDEVILYSHYNHISKEQVISILYFAICAVFFVLLIQALFRIWRLLKKNPATAVENIQFIKTSAKGTPFSFLKFIFWNDAIDIETRTGRQVFKHEVAHVQEHHSYDKLFINIVMIFCWCNPFFWLIRKELNMIHEFIADKKAVEDGDTADFAAMILQATYPQYRFPIANNFFYSPIKRRLTMLTKQNQAKVNYISRLLVLPLAVIVFAAFTLKTKTYSDHIISPHGKTITVVIDAGHGGTDFGARSGNNVYEKDITLLLAKKVKELNQSDDIKIILTRENDIYQSPEQKAKFAKDAGADLFISIHIDGAPESSTVTRTGMFVYVARDQYKNSEASKLLASSVIATFQKNYGLEVATNPQQRQAGLVVLQANSFPSILIEAGCINNPKDLAYLQTDKAIDAFAANLLKAIVDYAATKNSVQALSPVSFDLSVDVKNTDSAYLKSETIKSKALVIVDSKEIGNLGYNYVEKNLASYSKITVYDPVKAINMYGEKGKYGVLELTTSAKKEKPIPGPGFIDHDMYIEGFGKTPGALNIPAWIWDEKDFSADTRPLFILNGKEVVSIKTFKVSNDNISDLRLLTPKTAMATYGAKAKNGVIIINTYKSPMPMNALIVLDGKIYDKGNWSQVMAENGNRPIEKMELLEKEDAIKKFGIKGGNGAIIATTRQGYDPNPNYTLSGISGPKVDIGQLKNMKEVLLSSPDYSFKYATVYFSGAGFPNVVMTQITSGSLDNLQPYLSKVIAGTTMIFDNVKIEKKNSKDGIMEINGKAFSFYDPAKDDIIFTKVEVEPEFPGGKEAWQDFLRKNLDAGMPVDEGWKPGVYKIVVQFIVDVEGNVSDVKTDDHPESKTAQQCINLIKNGPKWVPATQNGKTVKAYRKQPITFVVSEQ